MIVKFHPAQELFLKAKRRLGLDDVQIGKDAIFALAQAMEAAGLARAEAAFAEKIDRALSLRAHALEKLAGEEARP